MVTLEMEVNTTQAGLYTVSWGYKKAPLDIQEEAFRARDLEIVSPAQLGFLRAKQEGDDTRFNGYSRTSADVFYDDRSARLVIVPDGAISRLVGIAHLVSAHRERREYIIPKDQRDLVYARVDELLRNGAAFIAPHGRTNVRTSQFGETEFTSRLFSDESLGANAQEYGDWLQSKKRKMTSFFMRSKDYSRAKNATLNKLFVCGPGYNFLVNGVNRNLDFSHDAFGVRFEKITEGGKR